jgi:hypothetical protein
MRGASLYAAGAIMHDNWHYQLRVYFNHDLGHRLIST